MDSSGQKPQSSLASSSSAQEPDLDAVFSTFFEKLEQLPSIAKPRSAKEYLQSNRVSIIHALSKGYTYEDLVALLKDCGFSISASTLRRYIGAVKGKKGEAFTNEVIPDATNLSELSAPPNSMPAATQSDTPSLRPRRK